MFTFVMQIQGIYWSTPSSDQHAKPRERLMIRNSFEQQWFMHSKSFSHEYYRPPRLSELTACLVPTSLSSSPSSGLCEPKHLGPVCYQPSDQITKHRVWQQSGSDHKTQGEVLASCLSAGNKWSRQEYWLTSGDSLSQIMLSFGGKLTLGIESTTR